MNEIYILLIGILQETITDPHISTVPPTEQVTFVITPPDDQSRVLETMTSSQQSSNDVVTNVDLEIGNGVDVVPEGQEEEKEILDETKEESEEGNENNDEKLTENVEKSEEQKPEEMETQRVVEEEEEVKQEVEVAKENELVEEDIEKELDIPEQKDPDPNSGSIENSSIPFEKAKSFDSSVGEVQPISNTPPSEEQTKIVVPKTSGQNGESKLDRPSTPTEVKSKLTPSPEIMTSSPILEVKRFVHRKTCQTSY